MKLYCVRHGEALSAEANPQRPLSDHGKLEIKKLAGYLTRLHLKISHILHSNKLRAIETAEIIATELSIKKVTHCETILNEDADIESILEVIRTQNENTMLVGHLPFMYKLINALLVNDQDFYPLVNFFPGSVVCLEYSEDQHWMIDWIIHPKIIIDH